MQSNGNIGEKRMIKTKFNAVTVRNNGTVGEKTMRKTKFELKWPTDTYSIKCCRNSLSWDVFWGMKNGERGGRTRPTHYAFILYTSYE